MTLSLTGQVFIGGEWLGGKADGFNSVNPSDESVLWEGAAASGAQVKAAFEAAHEAFPAWSLTPLEARMACALRFKDLAIKHRADMAEMISRETGKLFWDANGEAGALSAKVDISHDSYLDRTGENHKDVAFGRAELHHRAHGVMAVLGPYNFPAHLPNGQIIPSLIAGNTVVFKPSEQTPAVGELLMRLYAQAGFPAGVVNLVQGARDVGAAILDDPNLDGLLFTGSPNTGAFIHKHFGGRPNIILALEMGGNNPLVIWDTVRIKEAVSLVVQSAFITSGQRCSCSRRLIIPNGPKGEAIITELKSQISALNVGPWQSKTANIGPVVSGDVAGHVMKAVDGLIRKGGKALISPEIDAAQGAAFLRPSLIDVTGCDVPDAEIFGPVLQLIRVDDWNAAITQANNTRYGLAAGLISDDKSLWDNFRQRVRAGVVNFNRPTTGAASFLPFGGPGMSGNHNPGAYYAADFCAWPMASQVAEQPEFIPLAGPK